MSPFICLLIKNGSMCPEKGQKQAGAVLGQAQIKLELELIFSSLMISCI